MTADVDGGLVRFGAVLRLAVDDLKGDFVDVLHELDVEFALALEGVGLLETLRQRAVAADIDAEAADRPQQELDVALHEAVVRLGELRCAVDLCVVDGDLALVALDGDGQWLGRALFIGVDPHAEGNEILVELRQVLDLIVDAEIIQRPLLRLRGFLRDDLLHRVPLLLHVGDQLELGAGADEIVLGIGDLEIAVAVEVVRQEADGQLQRDDLRAERQQLRLFLGQAAARGQVAARIDAEELQIELHLLHVRLVLGGGRRAEADGVAEVVQGGAGHDRVEVENAHRLAGLRVQQDVVQLGVVVRNAQGQLAGIQQTHQRAGFFFPLHDERDLVPDGEGPVNAVGVQRLAELAVAVDGVVEHRDRFVEGLRGEVAQQLLEAAEGDRALIEILVGFRRFEADTVRELVAAPVFAVLVHVVVCTLVGENKVERFARIADAAAQVFRHRADVLHDRLRVGENVLIDPLQDIDVVIVGLHAVGAVDVAGAEFADDDRRSADAEMLDRRFRRQFILQRDHPLGGLFIL